jgi:hypothetical protein
MSAFGSKADNAAHWLRSAASTQRFPQKAMFGSEDCCRANLKTSLVGNDLDLPVKPRDPEASIRVALRDVQCVRCNGHGKPRIIALAQHPSI